MWKERFSRMMTVLRILKNETVRCPKRTRETKTVMKLVLVCEVKTLCTGLALWLDQQPDMEVSSIVEFDDAEEKLVAYAVHPPDILLIECRRVDASMSDLLSRLRELSVKTPIIVVGASPESKQTALEAGANAFVYEGDGSKRLLTTIRSVYLDSRHAA